MAGRLARAPMEFEPRVHLYVPLLRGPVGEARFEVLSPPTGLVVHAVATAVYRRFLPGVSARQMRFWRCWGDEPYGPMLSGWDRILPGEWLFCWVVPFDPGAAGNRS